MDDTVIAGHLENLDRRLARVEQILPTLATKEELGLAIAPLATRQELDEKAAELLHEIREEGQRSRRHMDVLIEGQHAEIRLLDQQRSVVMARLPDR